MFYVKKYHQIMLALLICIFPIVANANCNQITDRDAKNMCLAKTKNNHNICRQINDSDQKNYCLAIVQDNHNICNQIKNKDLRQECLALTK